jgi:type IV pilus assembly protein PilO
MRFGLREALFVMLLLAMPVAAYFFVFEPRNAQIAQANEEIRQKQQKLTQLDAATKSMLNLGEEIDKLAEAIEVFERKLPAQREVEVILKEVWELAAAHNLKPKSVRTDKIVSASQYAELPIKMVIVGDFDGFYSFMLQLEKLSRITRMPTMSLEKLSGDNEGMMQADLVLSIFFEGEGTTAPPTSDKGRRL